MCAALDDAGPDCIIELGGPERITFAEGARRVARAVGRKVRIIRVPRFVIAILRRLGKLSGFGTYEAMLFFEMIADVGYDCDAAPARELLGRELTNVDDALRDYYVTHRITPWRDTNFGTLRVRGK